MTDFPADQTPSEQPTDATAHDDTVAGNTGHDDTVLAETVVESSSDAAVPLAEDARAEQRPTEPVPHHSPEAAASVDDDAGVVRHSNRERFVVRALWVFVTTTVMAALVAPFVGAAVESRTQERRALAHAIAYGMKAPAGAVASQECHGEGLVSCWRVDRPVEGVADEVQWAIGDLIGMPGNGLGPDIRCDKVPDTSERHIPGVIPDVGSGFGAGPQAGNKTEQPGLATPTKQTYSCVVATRFGGSGVFVFVDPAYVVGRHGERMLTGSLVSVTAP